jgi:type II secretory pathway pseudopilin PulG
MHDATARKSGEQKHDHDDDHDVDEREQGFTVLRLIVVTAALVVALGIGALVVRTRTTTTDHLARSRAEAAATAAADLATENGRQPTAEQLAEYEPSLDYEKLEPGQEVAVQGKVYVRVRGEVAQLAARSGETCYWVQETPSGRLYATAACDVNPDQLHFANQW